MTALSIDIWSDIACPWCYVGKRRLEAALQQFPHREQVAITWRAFELDPRAPKEHEAKPSYAERLAKKYGTSPGRADEMIARVAQVAAADGLDFRFDRIRAGNTFDAHRLIHLAKDHGLQDVMKERLLRAYFTDGVSIGNTGELLKLAEEVGLDGAEARELLAGDRYADAVRGDEREAQELGISGVPFFVLGGRYAVSGAQPSELFARALREAWDALEASPASEVSEGAVCGPDGCA